MSSLAANPLRTSLRRAASCSRFSSTQASPSPSSSSSKTKLDVQPKTELPPEKMRGLVDLYHESSKFITPANLSDKIDEAFIHRRLNSDYNSRRIPVRPLTRILYDLKQRQARPKFGQSMETKPHHAPAKHTTDWSQERSQREWYVMRTLYGVNRPGKPGYEALVDELESGAKDEEVGQEQKEKREQSSS